MGVSVNPELHPASSSTLFGVEHRPNALRGGVRPRHTGFMARDGSAVARSQALPKVKLGTPGHAALG